MMNPKHEVLRELDTLQTLATRAGLHRRAQFTALFNAALVFMETDAGDELNGALGSVLRTWIQSCSAEIPDAPLQLHAERLLWALFSLPRPVATQWSLGMRLVDLVHHLRADLGLSMLYIHRHLSEHLGLAAPYGQFLGAVERFLAEAEQALAGA